MQEEPRPLESNEISEETVETLENKEETAAAQTAAGTEETGADGMEKTALPDKPWHRTDAAAPAAPPPEAEPLPTQEEKSSEPVKAAQSGGPTLERPIKRPRHKDKILHMDYKLTYEQVYETFTLLGKKSRTLRVVQVVIMVLAVLSSLLAYMVNEGNSMFLLAIVVFFVFAGYLLFLPDNKRKKQAAKVMEMDPTYKLKIYSDGTLESPLQGRAKMGEDKKAVSVEGTNVFAIGLQKKFSYCIPKSYLEEEEATALREVLQAYTKFRKDEKLRK